MIENQNAQGKLVSMLTEIYNQLEELETTLEASYVDLREKMHEDQHNNLLNCDKKLETVEVSINPGYSEVKKSFRHVPQSLKLELGY